MIDSVFLEASAEIEAARRLHEEPYGWELHQALPQRYIAQKRCEAVYARNRVSLRIAFLLTLAVGAALAWYVQVLSHYSGAAQAVGYSFAALLGVAMGWILLSAFAATRMSAWACGFVRQDENLSPEEQLERNRFRELFLNLEYRPPFSMNRPMARQRR